MRIRRPIPPSSTTHKSPIIFLHHDAFVSFPGSSAGSVAGADAPFSSATSRACVASIRPAKRRRFLVARSQARRLLSIERDGAIDASSNIDRPDTPAVPSSRDGRDDGDVTPLVHHNVNAGFQTERVQRSSRPNPDARDELSTLVRVLDIATPPNPTNNESSPVTTDERGA